MNILTTKAIQLSLAAPIVLASSFAMANNTHDLNIYATDHGHSITYETVFNTGVIGAFTDTLNFTVPNTSPLWNFSAHLIGSQASIAEFTGISLEDMTGITFLEDVFAIAELSKSAVANFHAIAPGDYSLIVSGLGANGADRYAMTAVLSPVPEPSSIALMLGGLGLVGFMAARRRKNT